ncbi:hypothetical protein NQ318_012408 [Aromia moschata]|uniref:Uncharacterized protein n=1 Tax=Aromia moschata TaxID=1265417 RepID=A0AAV8Y466_9CUCU|nr:hypothetical protein NQ318_012408 [Aromia moschata]
MGGDGAYGNFYGQPGILKGYGDEEGYYGYGGDDVFKGYGGLGGIYGYGGDGIFKGYGGHNGFYDGYGGDVFKGFGGTEDTEVTAYSKAMEPVTMATEATCSKASEVMGVFITTAAKAFIRGTGDLEEWDYMASMVASMASMVDTMASLKDTGDMEE